MWENPRISPVYAQAGQNLHNEKREPDFCAGITLRSVLSFGVVLSPHRSTVIVVKRAPVRLFIKYTDGFIKSQLRDVDFHLS